jgi:hypothetical protein
MRRYDAATLADYFVIFLRRALLVSATNSRPPPRALRACLVELLCGALLVPAR